MKICRQAPLFCFALAFLGGILIAPFLKIEIRPLILMTLGLSLLSALNTNWRYSLRKNQIGSFFLLLLGVMLGCHASQWQQDKAIYELESLNCHEVIVEGIISKPVKSSPYGKSTELILSAYLDTTKSWKPIQGKFQLYLEKEDTLQVNRFDKLHVRIYVSQIQTTNESYRSWLEKEGLFYRAYVKKGHRVGKAAGLQLSFYSMQQRLAGKLDTLISNPDKAAMAKAILLGEKGALTKTQKENFATAGLSHILAISGMHVGIIFLLLSLMLSPLHLLPGGQQFKSGLILLLLIAYMLLAGASPAVVRATLMFGAVLIYKLFRKRYHFLNLLGFSAFIQMVLDPMILFSVGFQLSYMAVLGIVLLFPLFEKSFNTPWKWLNYAYAWIGISLTATLFTTPWVLYYFGQFPTYFILSNVMVSLLVFVLVFLGFLTVLCMYVPYLNSLLAYMMEKALSLLDYIASWVAALPGARLTTFSWDEPGLRYLVIELALTALILLLPKLILYKKPDSNQNLVAA